jgi:choline dehydrogenase-like flavoprotein
MGTVVDKACRVRGIEGVRVVDSSVFPSALGAHYQAAVCAVAEQVSAGLIWFKGTGGKLM